MRGDKGVQVAFFPFYEPVNSRHASFNLLPIIFICIILIFVNLEVFFTPFTTSHKLNKLDNLTMRWNRREMFHFFFFHISSLKFSAKQNWSIYKQSIGDGRKERKAWTGYF